MISITRVLVPVDLSELSHRALTFAAELAEKFAANLSVLYVVSEPAPVLPDMMMPVPLAAPDDAELIAAGRQSLDAFLKGKNLSGRTPDVQVRVGTATPEILAAAKELPADLIVLGTHGHHGLAHLLLGSVAEEVVRSATCPVLTLRG